MQLFKHGSMAAWQRVFPSTTINSFSYMVRWFWFKEKRKAAKAKAAVKHVVEGVVHYYSMASTVPLCVKRKATLVNSFYSDMATLCRSLPHTYTYTPSLACQHQLNTWHGMRSVGRGGRQNFPWRKEKRKSKARTENLFFYYSA